MIYLNEIETVYMPDGLVHIKHVAYDNVISARIRTSDDLIKLCMVANVLSHRQASSSLNLTYLSAMRMDRQINNGQPNSLEVMCGIIDDTPGLVDITIHCPHSDVFPALFRNSNCLVSDSDIIFYDKAISKFTYAVGSNFAIILPDGGMSKKWFNRYHPQFDRRDIVECGKHRDMETGKLSGFKIYDGNVAGKNCLIVDDLCDGGGTFVGLAEVLKENGANTIALAAFHGIFSKGLPLPNIDIVYTTDSYADNESTCIYKVYKNEY